MAKPKVKKETPRYAKYICRDDDNEEFETASTLEEARNSAIGMLANEHQSGSIEIYKLIEISERTISAKIVPYEDK